MLAHFILFVGPTSFTVDESILHMQMAILGGLGSLPGSILGAVILTIVPQVLQAVWEYRMLLNGILMVVLMVWRPEGILGSPAAGASVRKRFRRLLIPRFGGKNKKEGV
jgi:branched-chain amino acid transport system permease protein